MPKFKPGKFADGRISPGRYTSGESTPGKFTPGKWRRPGKKVVTVLGILMVLALGCIGFTGCSSDEAGDEKVQDLEFTVIGEKDVPQALAELIAKKKENPFKLTYADGQDMYIVIGKGPQTGGGYSIVVKELYLTENSVVIRTELMGPEKGEATGTDTSYPVLIVKTAFTEEPVVFK